MKGMNRDKLTKQCDEIWYQIVMEGAGYICEVCGQPANQAHHFFPKSMSAILRHETKNGIPICMGCHFYHHHKGDPKIHQTIIEKRGKEWYNELKEKSKQLLHSYRTKEYYQNVYEKLLKEQKSL